MSGKRMVNLESNEVVEEKSRVVLKALSELISTKYKIAMKNNEKEEMLDKICNVIANKGRFPSQRQLPAEPLNPPKSEIIRRVKVISHRPGGTRTQLSMKCAASRS